MRRFAVTVAILAFLGLAAVGMVAGVPTLDCALRALGGAAVLYVVVSAAGRLVINIMVDAVISSAADKARERGAHSGDNRN